MTITKRIFLGVTLILLIGLGTIAVIYQALRTVEQALYEVTNVRQPTSAAAYEMEINVIGTGLGVLKYLHTRDPKYRDRVAKDTADFAHFHAQYNGLSQTARSKLGEQVEAIYREFRTLGQALMDRKDQQEKLFATVAINFDTLDDIIDDRFHAHIDRIGPDGQQKIEESVSLEADSAEVGTWLGHYLRTHQRDYHTRIFDNATDFQTHLAILSRLRLTEEERRWVGELETLFPQILSRIQEMLAADEQLQAGIQQFLVLRGQLDDLLDDRIQALTQHDLQAAEQEATHVVERALWRLAVLLLAFLLSGVGASFLLIRGIHTPLKDLMQGVFTIGQGDLRYRLAITGRDEFTELARQFNQMATQLEATLISKEAAEVANRVKSEFLATISHELRTPLSIILGYSKMLREGTFGPLASEQAEAVREIHKNASVQLEFISDLLKLRSLETNSTSLDVKEVLVPKLFEELEQETRELWELSGLRCEWRSAPDLRPLFIDAKNLKLVLKNLLSNAAKFTDHGSVTVAAQRCQEGIEISVTDTGIGIPKDKLTVIFELFRQLDGSDSRRYGGAGLGLHIVKRLLESLGGTITVESEGGRGSRFRVWLPIAPRRVPSLEGAA